MKSMMCMCSSSFCMGQDVGGYFERTVPSSMEMMPLGLVKLNL